MAYKKSDITHIALYENIYFYLIEGEQTISSLKYSLGKMLAQNENFVVEKTTTVEDQIIVCPIEKYDKKIEDTPMKFFKNIKDMERFFEMNR